MEDSLQLLIDFTVNRPEVVKEILINNGYKLSNKVDLKELVDKSLYAIKVDGNEKFKNELDAVIGNGEYMNLIGAFVSVGLSVFSAAFGASQARKQREYQALSQKANLALDETIAKLQIDTQAATERNEILINSIENYASTVQTASTESEKNTMYYLLAIGLGIGVIYATTVLLKQK
jgi:hypothetical protein